MPRYLITLSALLCLLALPAAAAAAPPKARPLDNGWQIRDAIAAPADPQPAPPDESEEGTESVNPRTVRTRASQANTDWRPVSVPGVFSTDAQPSLFGGTVKIYRLRFMGPRSPGYHWAFRFEQSRRRTTVTLNGRRLGVRVDPYTPFELAARGLKPGQVNELLVTVDSRKDARLPEGWWNWGGITRPVWLIPRGRVNIQDIGLMSSVRCRGRARRCRASVLFDGVLSKLPRGRARPRLVITLRSPTGRMTRKGFTLGGSSKGRRRVRREMRVPAPRLWAPERPNLYRARMSVHFRGRTEQAKSMKIGLRSVKVKRGLLYLNNRRIQLRGASMHEDFRGRGAALDGIAMDTMVRELKEAGANVTRAHYLFSEGLLRRLDEAGIMVWNQAPVWQRDHGANLLKIPRERNRAVAQVRRTIIGARSHPSVITHSVANELSFIPDRRVGTRTFLIRASEHAKDLDPTLPVALDIKGRPGFEEQFIYTRFNIIGINQYFGWYPWVADFFTLEPYLREMRDLYPGRALVMTEFGAEGRPDMANSPITEKGSYAFQAMHVGRTLDLVDRLPFMSGAIHWTLREFEIYPGWRGGAVDGPGRNTRHHKGVLTYNGQRKPAWGVMRDHFLRIPLYP